MKTTSVRLTLISEFLDQQGWTEVKAGHRFRRMRPPERLGLEPAFSLPMPIGDGAQRDARYINDLVRSLSEFHNIAEGRLRALPSRRSRVFTVRLEDESTAEGSVPLIRFEGLIDRIKKTLADAASFVISDQPILDRQKSDASKYVEACRFLQTEVGSFVASVQVPEDRMLVEASFIDNTAEITSQEVNSRVEEVFGFVTQRVMRENDDTIFSTAGLNEYADVLNVNVLQDVADIFAKAHATKLDFSFLSLGAEIVHSSGAITPPKIERLDSLIATAREHFGADVAIDTVGRVVELRSRDPRHVSNYVLVQADVEGRPSNIALTLPSADYYEATQAHALGAPIRLIGTAKRMRTQLRITELGSFQVQFYK